MGASDLDDTTRGYARWRRVFGLTFAVSTLILVSALAWRLPGLSEFLFGVPSPLPTLPTPTPTLQSAVTGLPRTPTPSRPVTPVPTPTPGGGNLEFTASAVAIAASCLTSLTSLIGFIFTTVVGIRKERRESQSAELDRKIRELELERQKLEMERKRLHPDEDDTSRKGD
jgi:hypothetical protein